ncbi:hypothetical protein PPUJ20028_32780 [Pseudomonas putida]|uniref:Uncharacterized protein n=1 Tax=Pseudomonas putida TaxID=303 RepID=A0AA37VN35_PSEPU|nr:hypothetical protein PPUJ20028_32780 [Pseudomonas putida]GLO34938.1 hypothetical protein PPUN14671_17710 [Pseudomonas putida]
MTILMSRVANLTLIRLSSMSTIGGGLGDEPSLALVGSSVVGVPMARVVVRDLRLGIATSDEQAEQSDYRK